MDKKESKKEYLSIPEFARLLGITRMAVYNKVKKGEIEAIKIGRNYAIPQRAIVRILNGKLGDADKKLIVDVVKKTLEEYGKVIKLLAKEDERNND
ncbi:MAG: helix-turn-helix domain-containing protein [Candidatus Omnitrophica bacterium]|nr:helix-turn-helix domain-containing protein [Candidatus Omnitrophota bacterium]